MQQRFFWSGLFFCALLYTNCGADKSKQAPAVVLAPLSFEHKSCTRHHCPNPADSVRCVDFEVWYPVFKGGDSVSTSVLNKNVQEYLLSMVGGNAQTAFTTALDSVADAFVQMFVTDVKENPERPMGYAMEIKDTIPFISKKVLTMKVDGYQFTGGAHGNPFGMLITFNLANGGKPLELTDVVADTNAVRPLLETAYKVSKGLKATDPLSDLVYPEITALPMPANVGVMAEGLRFYYNPYEIAPYAVGEGDVTISWETLGTLADKKKWVD